MHLRPHWRLAAAKPDFFYFYCSIKKIEDGNLCEICLQNFEITAIFALQYGLRELPTSEEKFSHSHSSANIFVSILVYIEYIAKIRKDLQEPEVFLYDWWFLSVYYLQKGIRCREQRCRKINLIACHSKLTEKVRTQNWRLNVLQDDHMRTKRNAENIRVCMGIFTTTLRK